MADAETILERELERWSLQVTAVVKEYQAIIEIKGKLKPLLDACVTDRALYRKHVGEFNAYERRAKRTQQRYLKVKAALERLRVRVEALGMDHESSCYEPSLSQTITALLDGMHRIDRARHDK